MRGEVIKKILLQGVQKPVHRIYAIGADEIKREEAGKGMTVRGEMCAI